MNRIFNLKKWASLPEAAAQLSKVFEESVTEADLYHLAIAGHLRLSVNLVNHGNACFGSLVPLEQAEVWILAGLEHPPTMNEDIPEPVREAIKIAQVGRELPEELSRALSDFIAERYQSDTSITISLRGVLAPDDSAVVEIDTSTVNPISGVWDLSMYGAERLDIERRLMDGVDGPELELDTLDDLLLIDEDRQTVAALRSHDKDMGYFPASDIPQDAMLVVRINELQRFIAAQSGSAHEDVTPRIEESYLKTVAILTKALAERAGSQQFGNAQKPNVSRIYDQLLSPHIDDIPGLSKSSVSARINRGLQLIS